MTLSTEELKRESKFLRECRQPVAACAIDELIAIREQKCNPVAWIVRPNMVSDFSYVETDARCIDVLGKTSIELTPLFTVPQPAVVPESLIDEVCHTAAGIYQVSDEDAAQVIIDDIRVRLSAVPKLGTDNA